MRFGKSGKLSLRFIGPFKVPNKVGGPVAYRLVLPPQLSSVHDVFHVSRLHKYDLSWGAAPLIPRLQGTCPTEQGYFVGLYTVEAPLAERIHVGTGNRDSRAISGVVLLGTYCSFLCSKFGGPNFLRWGEYNGPNPLLTHGCVYGPWSKY